MFFFKRRVIYDPDECSEGIPELVGYCGARMPQGLVCRTVIRHAFSAGYSYPLAPKLYNGFVFYLYLL